MLHDELKISLPFYDDINKQTRYRAHCLSVCEYKNIWPEYTLPPFQIRFEPFSVGDVNTWYIRCADDDSLAADLSPYKSAISASPALTEAWYHYYAGTGIPFSLPCGDYYYEVEVKGVFNSTPYTKYYSEVFTVVSGLNDIAFTQSDPPLFSLWRWYDSQDKTTANQAHCAAVCEYFLLCGVDALLPFQFRFEATLPGSYAIEWTLVGLDDTCYQGLDHLLLTVSSADGYNYVTYDGQGFRSDLPCGYYYSKIVIDGQYTFYSEPIYIHTDVNTPITNYILQQNGSIILLENGFGLLQE